MNNHTTHPVIRYAQQPGREIMRTFDLKEGLS